MFDSGVAWGLLRVKFMDDRSIVRYDGRGEGPVKIRMQGNSIRLRLSRSEVDQALREGRVCATVCFPGGSRLEYALERSPASGDTAARFAASRIVVSVPEAVIRQWATTEEVSIHARQPLEDGHALAILVEKDFACVTPRAGEDDSDMFPNPQKGQENC